MDFDSLNEHDGCHLDMKTFQNSSSSSDSNLSIEEISRQKLLQRHIAIRQIKLQRKELKEKRRSLIREKLKWVELRKKLHLLEELRQLRKEHCSKTRSTGNDDSIMENSYMDYVALDSSLWTGIQDIDSKLNPINELLESTLLKLRDIKKSSSLLRRNSLRRTSDRAYTLKMKKKSRHALSSSSVNLVSKMNFYTKFYSQATWDLSCLISIRKQWDQYLVSKETPGGSRIPESFVEPSPPSDANWSRSLACRRRTPRLLNDFTDS